MSEKVSENLRYLPCSICGKMNSYTKEEFKVIVELNEKLVNTPYSFEAKCPGCESYD